MRWFQNFKMSWYRVFLDKNDPLTPSRRYLYLGNVFSAFSGAVTGGVFYTALILILFQGHPESLRNEYIGNITMVQTAAGFLQMVAPQIIERIHNRKLYALLLRWASSFFGIVGLGVIPLLPMEIRAKADLFMIVAGFNSACSALSAPAISAWHIYSVTEECRSDYFTIHNTVGVAISHVASLLAAAFMDLFVANQQELAAVLIMRGVAVAMVTFEGASWWKVAEPTYTSPEKRQSILDILLVPFRYPLYLLNVLFIGMWTITHGGVTGYYNAYLVADAKLSYTMLSAFNVVSLAASFIFMPLWNQIIRKYGWFRPMAVSLMFLGWIYGLNIFVTEETKWLYLISNVVCQMTIGGYSLGSANLPYMNAPKEGMSSCLAFYSTFNALMGFVGSWLGKEFIRLTDGRMLEIFGLTIKNNAYISVLPFLGSFPAVALLLLIHRVEKKKKAAEKAALSA